jgi:hypothetical protein
MLADLESLQTSSRRLSRATRKRRSKPRSSARRWISCGPRSPLG